MSPLLLPNQSPVLEDDMVTVIDPQTKEKTFGRIILLQVRPTKKFWFVYIPTSKLRHLYFLTQKLLSAMTILGNYNDCPARWESVLRGAEDANA